jgi:hypothetical protein
MNCANCNSDALYVYQITLGTEILYCDKHLPAFLNDRKNAGLLPTTDAYKAIISNYTSPVVEAAPVEEPAAEPVAEDVAPDTDSTPTPTTAKKTVKKAATKNASNS